MPYKAKIKTEPKIKQGIRPHYGYGYGRLQVGEFATATGYWESCRELFLLYNFNSNTKFFHMCAGRQTLLRVANFIAKFEEVGRIKPSERLRFVQYEDEKYIIGIEVSSFWSADSARRGLLTILLRAASGRYRSAQRSETYDTMSKFWAVIQSCYYLRITEPAVRKFLSGKNRLKPRSHYSGWVNSFEDGRNLHILY